MHFSRRRSIVRSLSRADLPIRVIGPRQRIAILLGIPAFGTGLENECASDRDIVLPVTLSILRYGIVAHRPVSELVT